MTNLRGLPGTPSDILLSLELLLQVTEHRSDRAPIHWADSQSIPSRELARPSRIDSRAVSQSSHLPRARRKSSFVLFFPCLSFFGQEGGYPPWTHRPKRTPQVPASAFALRPTGKPRLKNRGQGSLQAQCHSSFVGLLIQSASANF